MSGQLDQVRHGWLRNWKSQLIAAVRAAGCGAHRMVGCLSFRTAWADSSKENEVFIAVELVYLVSLKQL